jgi:RimJ/RimL family protein N-acetyltransferase
VFHAVIAGVDGKPAGRDAAVLARKLAGRDEACTLRDGRRLELRAVTGADKPALAAFLAGLSEYSRAMRFFSAAASTDVAASWAAAADGLQHVGLVACEGQRIVGHAVYARIDPTLAEVAVEVAEDYRNAGVATLLLIRLARHASEHGISSFVADVLSENSEMLEVFHDVFAADDRSTASTEVESRFTTAGWRRAAERFDPELLQAPGAGAS